MTPAMRQRGDHHDAQPAVVEEAEHDDQAEADDAGDDAGAQLLTAQGGGDVVDLGDVEGQRQRAVLQHVGQLGRRLLVEVAGDLGPAAGDGRAHRRGGDRRRRPARWRTGSPGRLRWPGPGWRSRRRSPPSALKSRLTTHWMPFCGMPRWRRSAGCPRSGSGRAGTSRSAPGCRRTAAGRRLGHPAGVAGELGELGLVSSRSAASRWPCPAACPGASLGCSLTTGAGGAVGSAGHRPLVGRARAGRRCWARRVGGLADGSARRGSALAGGARVSRSRGGVTCSAA